MIQRDKRKTGEKGVVMFFLQSVIFSDNNNNNKKFFFHGKKVVSVDKYSLELAQSGSFSTCSYMNLFDSSNWFHLTGIKQYNLSFEYKGRADFKLYRKCEDRCEIICDESIDSKNLSNKVISFDFSEAGEKIFFEIIAKSKFIINNIVYNYDKSVEGDIKNGNPVLGLVICVYNGREFLKKNLDEIKKSLFFRYGSEFYGKIYMYITDNKKRMKLTNTSNLKIFHNKNTGGTGGFSKSLEKLREEQRKTGITHVIFMDDDVLLEIETLYRLFALLSVLKSDYKSNPVAGRMFDMARPEIQYTAFEIWNQGYIHHIGHNIDMSERKNDFISNRENIFDKKPFSLEERAINEAYGGWWFCCYPYEFCLNNTPVPFFLHCDDVEYGIRCGKTPIIMNGIHVLHEKPEKKANYVLSYYDARNTLIVNAIHGLATDEEMLKQWKNRLAAFKASNEYDCISMTILGMLHFLRGSAWLTEIDSELLNKKLRSKNFFEFQQINFLLNISYKVFWRLIYIYAKIHIREAVKSYNLMFKKSCKEKGNHSYEDEII